MEGAAERYYTHSKYIHTKCSTTCMSRFSCWLLFFFFLTHISLHQMPYSPRPIPAFNCAQNQERVYSKLFINAIRLTPPQPHHHVTDRNTVIPSLTETGNRDSHRAAFLRRMTHSQQPPISSYPTQNPKEGKESVFSFFFSFLYHQTILGSLVLFLSRYRGLNVVTPKGLCGSPNC